MDYIRGGLKLHFVVAIDFKPIERFMGPLKRGWWAGGAVALKMRGQGFVSD